MDQAKKNLPNRLAQACWNHSFDYKMQKHLTLMFLFRKAILIEILHHWQNIIRSKLQTSSSEYLLFFSDIYLIFVQLNLLLLHCQNIVDQRQTEEI